MEYVSTARALKKVQSDAVRDFEVRRVSPEQAPDWQVIDGALQHASRGFFSIAGARFDLSRSDKGRHHEDERLMLFQPQGALTGLLRTVKEGLRYYLLHARAEPGCLGCVQFGPTVQSTPANYLRLHGGRDTPYVEKFITSDADIRIVKDISQVDLGMRYLKKTKRAIIAETRCDIMPVPGFIWVSSAALQEAVGQDSLLNLDLRSLLALEEWSFEDPDCALAPTSKAILKSLQAPVRSEIVGEIMTGVALREIPYDFIAFDNLTNWRATETGFAEINYRQGIAVDFFSVKAPNREMTSWAQPLINSVSEGRVALACRNQRGEFQVLGSVIRECGLVMGAAIGPSYLRYPGETEAASPKFFGRSQRTLLRTLESDEGGRFFQDVSSYEIVLIDGAGDDQGDGKFWINLAELKLFLNVPNICTIQMRAIASHLLGVDPDAAGLA